MIKYTSDQATMNESQWYVLKVISGKEQKIKSQLETELAIKKLNDCVKHILVPTEKIYEVHLGKKKNRERSFFPGYIILNAALSNEKVIQVIRNISGALGFLNKRSWGFSKVPISLRQVEVDRLLGKADEAEDSELNLKDPFLVGEVVKIIKGAFKDFPGTIREIFEDRKKINVVINIFERNTPLELNYTQVEKFT